ncbi:mannitol dehydrogenase family protein [Mesorhizobium zhangyense]|nr:mannitol dehydrogenase family protein [Mesorhizobium zhangyense]
MSSVQTPVVQFGTSRFLQAYADLFLHEAGMEGTVTIVAASGSAAGRARLQAFSDPAGFPVIIRGLEAGQTVDRTIQVKSVGRGLDAEADWAELMRIVVEEAEFILSNTTESGFAVPAGLTLDLTGMTASAPPSYPAKLLALLVARFAAGRSRLTILPTELVGRNGDVLKRTVLDLARRSRASDALLTWIEEQCVFANSLVDRIVSAPLDPAGAIAEPYALWAVENQPGLKLPCAHPAIRIVDDLEPVERLKIHILNLGHSFLAETWLTGRMDADETVRGMLTRAEIRNDLLSLYRDEVIPGFAVHGMGEAASAYAATTMERFENPFLDHRLADIASGHKTKVARRIGGFIEWAATADTNRKSPRLAAIAAKYAKEIAA